MVLSIFDLSDYTSLLDIQPLKRINVSTGYNYYLNGQRLGIGTTNPQFELDVNGTIRMISMQMISDERKKSNIACFDSGRCLDIVKQIKIYEYTLNQTQEKKIGFIAQNVMQVVPTCVNNNDETLTIDVVQLVALTMSGLHACMDRLDAIEARLSKVGNQY